MAIQPKKHEEIHVTPDTIESSDSNKRDSRPNNGRRIIAGGLIGAAALGVLVGRGMAGGSEQEPGPEPAPPAATGEATPGAENPPAQTPAAPEATPTDIPSVETPAPSGEQQPAVVPQTFKDYQLLEVRPTSEEVLSYYSGLDSRWIEANGPDAGASYVRNFLYSKGANTPLIIGDADVLLQNPGLLLNYQDENGELVKSAEAANKSLVTIFNTYLANKSELDLDVDSETIINRRVFNAMGELTVRGMAETAENPGLCRDQFDCLMAHDNPDFKTMFSFLDSLPEGSSVVGVDISSTPQGRFSKYMIIHALLPDNTIEMHQITLENGFGLYPVSTPGLESSNTRALALNQPYQGAPAGEGHSALILLDNSEQIQERIGNANQQ